MNDFEKSLNALFIDTFNTIIKFEETSLKNYFDQPVTITETHIIEAVGAREGDETTVSDIATALDISTPTATVAIKKLGSKGYVNKIPCIKDGRRMLITLTEMGKKIDRAHRLFHTRLVRTISRQFDSDEKEVLFRAFTKLNEFFKVKIEA